MNSETLSDQHLAAAHPTEIVVQRQRLTCLGVVDRVSWDRKTTQLYRWKTYCSVCGASYEVTSASPRGFRPIRRCPAHRKPRRETDGMTTSTSPVTTADPDLGKADNQRLSEELSRQVSREQEQV